MTTVKVKGGRVDPRRDMRTLAVATRFYIEPSDAASELNAMLGKTFDEFPLFGRELAGYRIVDILTVQTLQRLDWVDGRYETACAIFATVRVQPPAA